MIFRLIWAADMEYKEDEAYAFARVLHAGYDEPWPWLGISSGVYIRNPGMSVWVFLLLGKLLNVTEPTDLVRGVQLLNILAIVLLIPLTLFWIHSKDRKSWLWAIALICVNPLAVAYQRKIWAQSVLPFFCVLFLGAWLQRHKRWSPPFVGFFGACLGQIHMSGFFFYAGFLLWTALHDRKSIHWKPWALGTLVGGLPLLPWIIHALTFHIDLKPTDHPIFYGWKELLQLRYWVFWMTNPLGLHLGNILGTKNGSNLFHQLADFFQFPLYSGHPTYGVALAHVILGLVGASIFFRGFYIYLQTRKQKSTPSAPSSDLSTDLMIGAALWGYGPLLTLSTVLIYRFYLLITFPLEFVWLARLALSDRRFGEISLSLLFLAQLIVSASFLHYIHVRGGAPQGDYGLAYHLQLK